MGKLGQILVTRGWITVQQLTRALKNQNVAGGRLGTCLLEMDALTEDLLLKGLAEQHGVPAAGLDDLRGVPDEVLRLLSDKLARRCRAVPFRVEGGRLDVAMMDPRNLSAQDEIAFASGKRVKVHVSHELRVLEALQKYYGEESTSRFNMVLDRLNRARFLWEKKEERPAPGEPQAGQALPQVLPALDSLLGPTPPKIKLPPLPEPDLPPTPRRPRPAPAVSPAPPASVAPVAAPPPAPAPVPALAASAVPKPAPRPVPVPAPAPAPRPVSVALTPEERVELGAARRKAPEPATLEEAETALSQAHDLDEIGEIVLGFLARTYRRVALFRVTRDRVSGWMAKGPGVDAKAFANFSLGFDQPSLFLNLRQGSGLHLGALPPMPAHRELARTWGGDLPRDCVMLPVRLRDRMVTVIYADGAPRGVSGVDLAQMQRLGAATAAAYERCVLEKKRSGTKS